MGYKHDKFRLKFYADKVGHYSNKYFVFGTQNRDSALKLIKYYQDKGNYIRSAVFQDKDGIRQVTLVSSNKAA